MKYLSVYNKKYLLAFVLVIIILSGCSKNNGTEPTPDPPGSEEPLRVMQTIYTLENQGTQYTDTLSYTYDDDGRVTSRSSAQGDYTEQFIYTDGKLTSLKTEGPNGTPVEGLNEAVYSANSDTILIDLATTGLTDTVQLTYIFQDDKQTDFWTYLHFNDVNNCGCMPERQLQKEKWYYNGAENLVKKTLSTPPTNEEHDWYTVISWDDKKNPKYGQPKLNALALNLNAPMESFGAHNVTSYTDGTNSYEVEITYNAKGYPLTFKLKDKNFISTRLIYNK